MNAQLLADVFGGELRPGVLVTAPRWEWLPAGDGVVVEEDLGADAIDAVRPRRAIIGTGQWGLRVLQVLAVLARPRKERPTRGQAVPPWQSDTHRHGPGPWQTPRTQCTVYNQVRSPSEKERS